MSDLKELSDSELVAQDMFLRVCGGIIEESKYGDDPEISREVITHITNRITEIKVELKRRRGLFF